MAILKCKMCGGNIQATDNTYGTCESCGTTSTLPKSSDERKANLYNRANHFRRQNDYDKAMQAYENILNEDSADAEALWGIVLSRYGIEYVEDSATGQRIPTCHRVQRNPILSDPDYLAALENAADEYTKSLYEKEAKHISEIQKGILAISNREKPYDVFICYKETTDGGSRTVDSTIAQDIYYQLTHDGYCVFFAKITLEEKLGQQYEPYIFNALDSAKVMLVIGTKPEHFNAVWVKNEWSRFLAMTQKNRSKLLIPCYRDMDAYDIPDELSNLQSQDMSKVGFMQDILRGLKKVLDAGKATETKTPATPAGTAAAPDVEALMKRGWLFLEVSDWRQAKNNFDKVLNIDHENASAYIGKLCVELKINSEAGLANHTEPLDNKPNYRIAMQFADENYRAILTGYNQAINPNKKDELFDDVARLVVTEQKVSMALLQRKFSIGFNQAGRIIDQLETIGIITSSVGGKQRQVLLKDLATLENFLNKLGTQCKLEIDAVNVKEIIKMLENENSVLEYEFKSKYNANEVNEAEIKIRENKVKISKLNSLNSEIFTIEKVFDYFLWEEIPKLQERQKQTLKSMYDNLIDSVNEASTGKHAFQILASDDNPFGKKIEGYDSLAENIFQNLAERFRSMNGYEKAEEWAKYCEEEHHRLKHSKIWKEQGLCSHCGGQMGGFFTKKCKNCGKSN